MWVMDEKDERCDEEGEAERKRLAERIKDKAVREERRAWGPIESILLRI